MEQDLVSCKHRGKEIDFRGSGTPDQLRGNPLIPVIENTTLGRRAALGRPPLDALAAITRKRDVDALLLTVPETGGVLLSVSESATCSGRGTGGLGHNPRRGSAVQPGRSWKWDPVQHW